MNIHKHPDEILLQDFLDGEISNDDRVYILQHLTECKSCSNRLSELRELVHLLEDFKDASLDRDLSPVVLSNLRSRTHEKRTTNWILLAQLCLTAVIITLLTPVISAYFLQIDAAGSLLELKNNVTVGIHQLADQLQIIQSTVLTYLARLSDIHAFSTHFIWPPSGNWIWIFPGSLIWLVINVMLLMQNGYIKKSTVRNSH